MDQVREKPFIYYRECEWNEWAKVYTILVRISTILLNHLANIIIIIIKLKGYTNGQFASRLPTRSKSSCATDEQLPAVGWAALPIASSADGSSRQRQPSPCPPPRSFASQTPCPTVLVNLAWNPGSFCNANKNKRNKKKTNINQRHTLLLPQK